MMLSRLGLFVRSAWRTLPVETLVVALASAGAIGLAHEPDDVHFLQMLLAGVVLTPLAVASHRLGVRRQAAVMAVAAAAALGALALALPDLAAFRQPTFAWPYGLALIAALLVPFVTAAQFGRFVRRFFEETTTWLLLGGAALAALGVIGVALQELFDLRLGALGADAVIATTAGVVLFYLDRILADDARGRVPELWRRLATVIGAPFVCAMLAILVAYEAVALARGELPRNVLSPLILAAGLVGFVTTMILTAVLDAEVGTARLAPADPHRWARRPTIRLARAFPVVLLALLPLAAWALYLRIDAYGVTPFRAVRVAGLACLAVLGVASTIRWWRDQPPLTWQVPATIAAAAVILASGPLGAVERSVASQTERLAHLLAAHQVAPVVRAEPGAYRKVDYDTYHALWNQLAAVSDLGGEPALRRVLSGDVAQCTPRWAGADCLERLGIRWDDKPVASERFELVSRGPFATEAGKLVTFSVDRATSTPLPDGFSVVLVDDGLSLHGREIAVASLAELIARGRAEHVLPPIRVELRYPDTTLVAWLSVTHLVGELTPAPRLTQLDGVLVYPDPR